MPIATRQPTWDARIARARELASIRPAARELLTFYAALAEYQKSLAATARDRQTDVEQVLDAIPGFLSWLRGTAPPALAASSVDLIALDRDAWRALVPSALHLQDSVASAFRRKEVSVDRRPPEGGSHPAAVFVVESLLQAFAEPRAPRDSSPVDPDASEMHCPDCGALPLVGVLREQGQGAKRFLLCARCLHEWECLRIVCTACGEQEFEWLPAYTAEQFPHVRIDACDRCHRYIKTIDLTKDGLAVPCVDDIASVSLDLWARERGYSRIKNNVLGI